MKHGRGFAQTVQTVQTKYRPRVNPLNLEAAVLGCVLGCVLALGRVLGLVVAGRFWCSYAWVSLTPTPPARPRAPVRLCARLCVRACAFL